MATLNLSIDFEGYVDTADLLSDWSVVDTTGMAITDVSLNEQDGDGSAFDPHATYEGDQSLFFLLGGIGAGDFYVEKTFGGFAPGEEITVIGWSGVGFNTGAVAPHGIRVNGVLDASDALEFWVRRSVTTTADGSGNILIQLGFFGIDSGGLSLQRFMFIDYARVGDPPGCESVDILSTRAQQRLVIFQDDDITPIKDASGIQFGDMTVDGDIVAGTFSTDPTEVRPWLFYVDEGPDTEVKLLEGTSEIGQVNIEILDKRTDPLDQSTGFVTRLLAGADGQTQWYGRRALLREQRPDGTWKTIIDGVIDAVELDDNKVKYQVAVKDMRDRERDKRAFVRSKNYCLFPQGHVEGWGLKYPVINPADDIWKNSWLIPPATFITGTLNKSTNGNQIGFITFAGTQPDLRKMFPKDGMTARQLWKKVEAAYGASMEMFDDLGVSLGYRFENYVLRWRVHGTGPWNVAENMPALDYVGPAGSGTEPFDGSLGIVCISEDPYFTLDGGKFIYLVAVALSSDTTIPANGTSIDLQVVAGGYPSEDAPLLITDTFGQILKDVYDGAYSFYPPNIRYNTEAMDYLVANTPTTEAVITEPVDDIYEWVATNIYQPLGMAPAMNEDGEIVPIKLALPPGDLTLPLVTDEDVHESSAWGHPSDNVVNKCTFKYKRYYLRPPEFAGEPPINRLQEIDSPIEVRIINTSVAVLGAKDHDIEPDTCVSVSSADDGSATVKTEEVGNFLGKKTGYTIIDRFKWGAPAPSVRVKRSNITLEALKVGDWVDVQISWFPDYETHIRGGGRLMQIVSSKVVDPTWKEWLLIDAGPATDGLQPPTFDPLYLVGTKVFADVTPWNGDVYTHVQYFVGGVDEPDPNSDSWRLFARMGPGASTFTIGTPDMPAGSTVWVRGRSELDGFRPSIWSTPISIVVGSAPYVYNVGANYVFPEGSISLQWSNNEICEGLRVYYQILDAQDEPLADTGTLPYEDLDAAADQPYHLTTIVTPEGKYCRLYVQAWSAFPIGGTVGNTIIITMAKKINPVCVLPMINKSLDIIATGTGVTGTLTLTIDDPQERLIKVEFRTRTSVFLGWSAYVEDTTIPYSETVNAGTKTSGEIGYRVTAVNCDGIEYILEEDSVLVNTSGGPGKPTIIAVVDPVTGDTTLTVEGTDADSAKLAYSTSPASPPTDADVRATTADSTAPFVFVGPNLPDLTTVGYARAFTYDSDGRESEAAAITFMRPNISDPDDLSAVEYLVKTASSLLSAERVSTDGDDITLDWSVAGIVKWIIARVLVSVLQMDSASTPGYVLTVDTDGLSIIAAAPTGGGGGEANTASNLGAGHGVFASKVGVDLQFKSIIAGTNVTVSDTGTEITINSSGGGSVVNLDDLGDVTSGAGPSTDGFPLVYVDSAGASAKYQLKRIDPSVVQDVAKAGLIAAYGLTGRLDSISTIPTLGVTWTEAHYVPDLTVGDKIVYVVSRKACRLKNWKIVLQGNVTGSVQFDLKKATDGTYPVTSMLAGLATDKPKVSSAKHAGWTSTSAWVSHGNTTDLAADDWLMIYVDSSATATAATLHLEWEYLA